MCGTSLLELTFSLAAASAYAVVPQLLPAAPLVNSFLIIWEFMVKITVEGELDTILSTRTETVTTTVVNQSQFYTLTTTTVEVTSRSAPSLQ